MFSNSHNKILGLNEKINFRVATTQVTKVNISYDKSC